MPEKLGGHYETTNNNNNKETNQTNNELQKLFNENLDNFRNGLGKLAESKNIKEHDNFLIEINKEIRELLSKDFLNLTIDKIKDLQEETKKLLGPNYIENESARLYAEILQLILNNVQENISTEEISNKILFILELKIPSIINKKFQNFLINTDFTTGDPIRGTQIVNNITLKNPITGLNLLEKYYEATIDPKDGYLTYTNLFSNQQG